MGLDFSSIKTKNPAATDGPQAIVERRVDRIHVFVQGRRFGPAEIKRMADIIRANKQISSDITTQASLGITGGGVPVAQVLANWKDRARAGGTSAVVIEMAKAILGHKVAVDS